MLVYVPYPFFRTGENIHSSKNKYRNFVGRDRRHRHQLTVFVLRICAVLFVITVVYPDIADSCGWDLIAGSWSCSWGVKTDSCGWGVIAGSCGCSWGVIATPITRMLGNLFPKFLKFLKYILFQFFNLKLQFRCFRSNSVVFCGAFAILSKKNDL